MPTKKTSGKKTTKKTKEEFDYIELEDGLEKVSKSKKNKKEDIDAEFVDEMLNEQFDITVDDAMSAIDLLVAFDKQTFKGVVKAAKQIRRANKIIKGLGYYG